MTENMKKFLEAISRDDAFIERMNKTKTMDEVIALAAEKGFALTEEDLNMAPASGELTDDEMDAVAGGKACYCAMGGGGTGDGDNNETCACIVSGVGMAFNGNRCFCAVGGVGRDDENRYMEKKLFGME